MLQQSPDPHFIKPSQTSSLADADRVWVWWALAAVGFAAIWFLSLGSRSLIHPDEGRYATLALEMARGGDWITPRLNGLLYFEKPALQYWIGALSFRLFGVNEFAARFWPGAAGFLTVLAVGLTAAQLWGRQAAVRALAVAGSTTWIVVNAHFLTLDAGLTFFLTVALCCVLLAECSDLPAPVRRRWVLAAWAAMAGAALSKGLVGIVIPGCALVLASLWLRDAGLFRRVRPVAGACVFLAVAAPWFVLVSLRNPGFAEFFFIHEHFARYLSEVHRREGAWWYYLPLLLAGLLPWTSALPWVARRVGAASTADDKARCLLLAWCGFVLVFFSLSGSKLPSYILPMFPALALLIAMQFRDTSAAALRWHLLVPVVVWVVILVAAAFIDRLASPGTPVAVLDALGSALRTGALIFLAGAGAAWWWLGRRRVTAAVVCVAFGHFAATTVVMDMHDAFGQLKSAEPVAEAVLPLLDAQTPVFAVRSYDQTLPFYLRRHIVLVDYVDEFAFGQRQEPGRSISSVDEFIVRWTALPAGVAYMTRGTWQELLQRGVPMRTVFEDPRRIVVSRR